MLQLNFTIDFTDSVQSTRIGTFGYSSIDKDYYFNRNIGLTKCVMIKID